MKILIVGSNESYAIEKKYHRYFKENGHEVDLYPLANLAGYRILHNPVLRILRRLNFSGIYEFDNKNLLKYISNKRPEVVWIFKGIEILPKTIRLIKSLKINIINYNPDHPFIRTFSASGGKNVEKCVPLYDLHFCYSLDLCRTIQKKYNIPTVYLPFGFELSEEVFQISAQEPELLKVVFVGNPDKYRKKIIQYLADNKVNIDVYGYGWNKWLTNNKYITIYNGVEKKDFWLAMRKYRVNLNIFRPHNEGSHNMRTFEIPAIGGIMLAPSSKEHSMFFKENEEFFTYTDLASLLSSCNYLLRMSPEDANRIRNNARNKCVKEDYTYRHNAKIVIQAFKDNL
jgi:spore maturation protein CgeB